MNSEPLPMIQKSINGFRRDLPELLKTHPGKWLADQRNERGPRLLPTVTYETNQMVEHRWSYW